MIDKRAKEFPTRYTTIGRMTGIIEAMNTEKLSVSLPLNLVQFVEQYKENHQCQSRSQVIERALQLLQEQELEAAYREAAAEVESIWEITAADGLNDETW